MVDLSSSLCKRLPGRVSLILGTYFHIVTDQLLQIYRSRMILQGFFLCLSFWGHKVSIHVTNSDYMSVVFGDLSEIVWISWNVFWDRTGYDRKFKGLHHATIDWTRKAGELIEGHILKKRSPKKLSGMKDMLKCHVTGISPNTCLMNNDEHRCLYGEL